MLLKLLNWIKSKSDPYRIEWVEDMPATPIKNTVYVIGGREYPFYAAVACPKKWCREFIFLEISPQFKRRWRIKEHSDGTISLFPSIHVTKLPCQCHYWLRRGKIVWSTFPSSFYSVTKQEVCRK